MRTQHPVSTSRLDIAYLAWNPGAAHTAVRMHGWPDGVQTLVLHGAADTCNHPDSSRGKESSFIGLYQRQELEGVGNFPQREAPAAGAEAILAFRRKDWRGRCGQPGVIRAARAWSPKAARRG